MSNTSTEALRTTMVDDQTGSKLERSACGTKRRLRAAARWDTAGVASPPASAVKPTDLRNPRRFIRFSSTNSSTVCRQCTECSENRPEGDAERTAQHPTVADRG